MRGGTDKSSGEGQGWMEHTEAVQAEVEQQAALLVMALECLELNSVKDEKGMVKTRKIHPHFTWRHVANETPVYKTIGHFF